MSEPSLTVGQSTSSLVVRLRGREPEAWQGFVRVYGPLIYSWCRTRWRLPAPDAAEVLQDVLARVLETVGDYRGDGFVAWLWAVTRSRAANYWQAHPDRAAGGSDALHRLAELAAPRAAGPAGDAPPEPGAAVPMHGVLQRALDRVRQRSAASSWRAFWEVTVEGRRPADVAADLSLSVNAVYIANSRILSRLRQELGEA
jgi:RNA polymerase sigma-70 factor (ECF subfamily)